MNETKIPKWLLLFALAIGAALIYHFRDNGLAQAPTLPAGKTHFSSTDNITPPAPTPPAPTPPPAADHGTTRPVTSERTLATEDKIKEVTVHQGADQSHVHVTVKTVAAQEEHTNSVLDMILMGLNAFISIIMFSLILTFAFRLLTGRPLLMRSGPGGMQPGGNSLAQQTAEKSFGSWLQPEEIDVSGWDDAAGVEEAKTQLRKIELKVKEQKAAVDKARQEDEQAQKNSGGGKVVSKPFTALALPPMRSRFGGKVPRGVLLEGPPGTGKTLLVTILAKVCGVPVFCISGADFVEMFVGLGASRVREMFDEARKKQPCIIFIDELDAVGGARHNGPGGHEERHQTLNQILVEMQGLNRDKTNNSLWILAATNRADTLDPALLRAGRFTWRIKVEPPALEGRMAILNVHIRKREMPLSDNVTIRAIASVLAGLTGADLENVVNETALYGEEQADREADKLRQQGRTDEEVEQLVKRQITQEDFFEGLLRHLMGLKKDVLLNFDELFNTVVHEWGHAVGIAYEEHLGNTKRKVRFIAVEPRGRTGGLTFHTPDRDVFCKTLDDVKAEAVCGYGGSAAQLVYLDVQDSGPDNDFEVVSEGIHTAIARWYGSKRLGPISLGQRGFTAITEMGERQRDRIDLECQLQQKVLYAKTWWLMCLFIRSDVTWTMFWELLRDKIMREDRFYALFQLLLQDVEAHPEWKAGSLETLQSTVEKNPDDWAPELLDTTTRVFIDERISRLKTRYEAYCKEQAAA